MHVTTSQTIVLSLGLLLFGFIWRTFFVSAPYGEFAIAVGTVAGINVTKRLLQKQEKYGCKPNGGGEDV